MKIRILAVALMVVLVSGCSLVFGRTLQEIYVTTPNAIHAYCTIETEKQSYQLLTPAKIHVERSAYDMIVTCNKEGYKTAYRTIKSRAVAKSAWVGLNKYTPGINMDSVTRTVYEYPEVISIVLSPKN